MIHELGLAISLALDKIAGVPAGWWFVIGFAIACIPATIGITALIKWRHFKKKAEKLASHFIVLNVGFWGFILASADFIVAHATNIVPLGALFPFITKAWPLISFFAILTHAVATGMKQWWQDRENKKELSVPDIDPAVLEELRQHVTQESAGSVQPLPTQSRPSDLFS